jgi:hypothetical protein
MQFEGGYDNEDSEDELEFEGGNGQRRRTGSRNPDAAPGHYQQLSGHDTGRGLMNDNVNA